MPAIPTYSELEHRIKKLEKEAKENEEYVESRSSYHPVSVYKKVFSIFPEDVEEGLKEYSEELENENEFIKERILASQ